MGVMAHKFYVFHLQKLVCLSGRVGTGIVVVQYDMVYTVIFTSFFNNFWQTNDCVLVTIYGTTVF